MLKRVPIRAPQRISSVEKDAVQDLPNLVEVQVNSYKKFLQLGAAERVNEGLEEVFKEHFPVTSYDGTIELKYISYDLGVPKYSAEECIRRGVTYSATLRGTFELIEASRGKVEEEVYLGTIPLMTSKGTFIINGAERVIVSQLHRSPGIYFEQSMNPKGQVIYSMRIIPYRGSWLEAVFDQHDCIQFYIERTKSRRRKLLATTFLRALGLSENRHIVEEFLETKQYRLKSEQDFAALVGKMLARDVVHPTTGTVFGKVGEKLHVAMLSRMLESGINAISTIVGAGPDHPIIKMLARDTTSSYDEGLKAFYRAIRPGEPATMQNARSAIIRAFFDAKRYNLGKVGRYKINQKLGFPCDKDEDLEPVTLRHQDIVAALKYLIRLRENAEGYSTDDIDHLGNRRVRTVGELVQNQCRIGLARMEKVMKEKMALIDVAADVLMPGKIISSKAFSAVLRDFFGRSQLSQFMDQTNPLAELTHKRRLSALGPGGLNRDRAGFEVRDVHTSHYGRICPIETPEGPNIGLITSLACYAKINPFGFINTPYRKVNEGTVTEEIEYLTADRERNCVIAQASEEISPSGEVVPELCWVRTKEDSFFSDSKNITHMDVSPKQLVSVATSLIPFLEHDDANRALMGSNMQRQAVPLLRTDAPIVGTGLEERTARDSGAVVIATHAGVVSYVDGRKIVVTDKKDPSLKQTYELKKFQRSNSGTCINQTPLCRVGDHVAHGDILADGPATDKGELALGRNVLVAFMPWLGYNYEDAIIISKRLVAEDVYTSIHIEDFEATARDTQLGVEKITRDIPNIPDQQKSLLEADGIIRVGAEVKAGDILVGMTTPKEPSERSAEEKMLLAIFHQTSADVKDASLRVPQGVSGVVTEIRVFKRAEKLPRSDDSTGVYEQERKQDIEHAFRENIENLELDTRAKLGALFASEEVPVEISDRKTASIIVPKGPVTDLEEVCDALLSSDIKNLIFEAGHLLTDNLRSILRTYKEEREKIVQAFQMDKELINKGHTDLDAGVMMQVKVRLATKRKLQVGDKMAGRHGNKGVVSKIVPEEDMPYLNDGTPIQMILNPLGVPSRMNLGQLLETNLGYAAKKLGIYVKTPVFEGFTEEQIAEKVVAAGLNPNGKSTLYDGRSGERFSYPVVVGIIYMMKLGHLVADKIHARSIGPYSLVTQQPLGGKAQMGGQRFGEMEVWALEAYGAAHTLQEMLTVKSDDVAGRTRTYKGIVNGKNLLEPGTPASFHVLMHELKGIALKIELGQKEI